MAGNFVTVAQVADMVDTTPHTVRVWICSGRLEAIRLPSGTYRIPRSAVEEMMLPVKAKDLVNRK
ncbi:helix-turn-helix domain-containing protein [Trueperella sp. LYQ143]|uniref:helix-turn-helix domain-containing protein n=1 Tax=Trueperella sp. LYQ143 TaxID=3391059 RepID=UPI0039837090